MNPLALYGILILIVVLVFAKSAYGGTLVTSDKVKAFAKAISVAEGFGIANDIPTKAHNPGDLVLGDRGNGVLGREGITIFPDNASGWNALYHELNLIVNSESHVYTLDMTISDMAYKWTDTSQDAWAETVANQLGVTRDTPLSQILV